MKTCECCNNEKELERYTYKKKTYYLCEDCDEDIGYIGLKELIDYK